MKLLLPDGQKHSLDDSLSLEEKKQVVEELATEWEDMIHANWSHTNIMYFLDTLANYLCWHKDEVPDDEGNLKKDTAEDKEVMSRHKTNRLYRGRRDTVFSNLNDKDKEMLFGERGKD